MLRYIAILQCKNSKCGEFADFEVFMLYKYNVEFLLLENRHVTMYFYNIEFPYWALPLPAGRVVFKESL